MKPYDMSRSTLAGPWLQSFFSRYILPAAHRSDIDGLRLIAVACVILFHLQIAGIPGGYVGVDVFFVISGYLITRMVMGEMKKEGFHLLNFFERRVRRIVPGLFNVLLVTTIGATLFFSPHDLEAFAESMIASLLFAANIYFYTNSGYFSEADDKPLLHLWSLGVEGQFYLVWPLLLVLILRHVPEARRWIPIAALAGLSLVVAIVLAPHHTEAGFYLLPGRLVEFLIGASILWLPRLTEQHKQIATAAFLLGLMIIIAAALIYTKHTPFPSFYALAPCLGAALVIYSGEHAEARDLLANPVMAYLGRISYELYLFHWPIIVFFKYRSLTGMHASDRALIILFTILFSAAFYHFVNKPLRYCWTKTLVKRQNMLIALQIVWVALMAVNLTMKHSHGWPWRLPKEGQLLVRNPGEFHKTQFGGAGILSNQMVQLGDTSAPAQFFIFGDSFAAQYGLALSDYLKSQHKSAYMYTVSGCLIYPHMVGFVPGNPSPECAGAFTRVQQFVQNSKLPVIQAQSWSGYVDKLYTRDGQYVSYAGHTNHEYFQFILDGIAKTQAVLGQAHYTIIGLSPGIPDQKAMSRCFQVPDIIPNHCEEHAAVPEEQRADKMIFNVEATAYFQNRPDVTFVNPHDVFCPDGKCYALRDGKIYYSDYLHLSKAGAAELIQHYHQVFDALHP